MGPGLPAVSTVINFAVHQEQIKASLHIIISAVASVKEAGANVPASPGTTHLENLAEVIRMLIYSLISWLEQNSQCASLYVRSTSDCSSPSQANVFMRLLNSSCQLFIVYLEGINTKNIFHLQSRLGNLGTHDLRLQRPKRAEKKVAHCKVSARLFSLPLPS